MIEQQPHNLLVEGLSADEPIVWHRGGYLTRNDFLADVHSLALGLPAARYVFNCCDDRYHFMVAFAAALSRGQINLLPPSRAPEVIRDIAAEYPDSYYLSDEATEIEGIDCRHFKAEPRSVVEPQDVPKISPTTLAALVFTSGSTGKPQPNSKTWSALRIGTRQAAERFFAALDGRPHILATVPPQHMYGFETTVLHSLLSGAVMHTARPLFPEDVRTALAELPEPRVLITTPIHLRAFVKAGLGFPRPAFIVSATAPLDQKLAAASEALFKAPVMEIYGCTEAGSLASRRNLDGERWHLYPDMQLRIDGDTALLDGPQLAETVPLADIIEQFDTMHFALRGRNADMLDIAGKRASLGDLNQRLLAIDGVDDGVMIQPEASDGPVTRLAALVVSERLSEAEIMAALREHIDPVFLPRPLYKVAALPRNATSKLPRQAVLDMLQQLESRG